MSSLAQLLTSLNECKAQILALQANRSSCMCEQRQLFLNGIISLTTSLDVSSVENVINNPLGTCSCCIAYKTLQNQYELLKSQVYDQINIDYSLTNETNPFIV